MSANKCVVAALAVLAVFAAGHAQARGGSGVQWQVQIGLPVPMVVFTAPQAVMMPAPVYVQPHPHYRGGAPVYGPAYRTSPPPYGYPTVYGHPRHWDVDGDGIPNRRDRVYNPRWDRDGDGIPDRHERYRR